jgi:hypothetical protein
MASGHDLLPEPLDAQYRHGRADVVDAPSRLSADTLKSEISHFGWQPPRPVHVVAADGPNSC